MNRNKPLYLPWDEQSFCADVYVQKMDERSKWMYRALLQSSFFCSTRPYLPASDSELWVLAGCENLKSWKKNKKDVLKMFTLTEKDGTKLYYRKRIVEEWDHLQSIRVKNTENIKKRWEKDTYGCDTVVLPEKNVGIQDRIGKVRVGEDRTGEERKGEETGMSLRNNITDICRSVLGIKPERWESAWQELNSIARIHGQKETIQKFKEWAGENIGEIKEFPISRFNDVSDGLFEGVFDKKENPDLNSLVIDMVLFSGNQAVFEKYQVREIGKLLEKFSKREILLAFKDFYGRLDEFQAKTATKKFVETAPFLIEATRKAKADYDQSMVQLDKAKAKLEAEATARIAAAATESAQDEVFDPLFDGVPEKE